MVRTGGEKTRQKILVAAEKLFAESGFDATSVDRIARAARVNKGLIYYYFKDKDDIVVSLFTDILAELSSQVEALPPVRGSDPKVQLAAEIRLMASRKRILSLMVMEALKSRERSQYLFRLFELVLEREHAGPRGGRKGTKENRRRLIHEFFTGFLPLVLFVSLQDKWAEHFDCDSEEAAALFVDAFARSHLASHLTSSGAGS
jgi:AcrR family transcriptional regulator